MPLNRILALALVILSLVAAVVGRFQSSPAFEGRPSQESASPSGWTVPSSRERIEVLTLEGVISSRDEGGFAPSTTTAPSLRRQLVAIAKDDKVKGVLLKLNSPGGTVGASQELYQAILQVRASQKPVVISMADIAASGAYYTASAADVIYANPGTLTGSIGVIIEGFAADELLKKIGIQPQTIKTGPFKDILSPTRPLNGEERDLLQAIVEDSLDQFVADIVKGRKRVPELKNGAQDLVPTALLEKRRNLTVEQVRVLADGRIFTGRQALGVGLVDVLGGQEEALAGLRQLVGDTEGKLPIGNDLSNFRSLWRLLEQTSGYTGVALSSRSFPSDPLAVVQQWLGLQQGVHLGPSGVPRVSGTADIPILWMVR